MTSLSSSSQPARQPRLRFSLLPARVSLLASYGYPDLGLHLWSRAGASLGLASRDINRPTSHFGQMLMLVAPLLFFLVSVPDESALDGSRRPPVRAGRLAWLMVESRLSQASLVGNVIDSSLAPGKLHAAHPLRRAIAHASVIAGGDPLKKTDRHKPPISCGHDSRWLLRGTEQLPAASLDLSAPVAVFADGTIAVNTTRADGETPPPTPTSANAALSSDASSTNGSAIPASAQPGEPAAPRSEPAPRPEAPDATTAKSEPPTPSSATFSRPATAASTSESTPQQLLELYGIEESQLRLIRDDAPLGEDDEETLERILYRIPRFPLHLLERWAKDQPERSDWLESPAAHRADAVRVEGRAVLVQKRELPVEAAARFEFDHYYLVTMEPTLPADEGLRWQVCTRQIPQAWTVGAPLDEPAAAVGLFFKAGPSPGGITDMVIVAPRVAWYPDRPEPSKQVSPDHVILAKLGMDRGLWDAIGPVQRKPILAEDREAFFQLMAAVSRSTPGQLQGPLRRGVDFGPLLQDPVSQQGQFATVEGTVRRIAKVHVNEPELQERFGIQHYYQVDMFVPLDRLSIRLGETSASQEGPAFNNTYPATVCVLKLPAGVQEGDDLELFLRIEAVFFKLWAYRSEYMSSFDDRQLQIGPLLIGLVPKLVTQPAPSPPPWGPIVGVVFGISLLLAWFGAIRWSRGDKKFERSVMRRQLAPQQSLNEVGLQARSEPDFSRLPPPSSDPDQAQPDQAQPDQSSR